MPMPTATAGFVNFTQFRLESHVEKALRKAWALAGGRPLSAGHVLQGVVLVARTDPSAAFLKLAALLPLPSLAEVKATDLPPADLAALRLTKPLADSFSTAESFLKDGGTVWGRDYVTFALLARDDPSLDDVAGEAGRGVAGLRREWLDFVCSTDDRRAPDEWRRWWRGAGVPLPAEAQPAAPAAAYLFT